MVKVKSGGKVTIGFKYFRELYFKRKILYPTTYFLFPTFTLKHKIPLSAKLHDKIMKDFFSIYFEEFYYYNEPKYFPLSGILYKTRGAGFYKKGSTTEKEKIGINWTWYQRPGLQYFSNIRLLKTKGGGRKVGKLDDRYKVNNDVGLLEFSKTFLSKLKETNKLFKHD